jgi:peptidoglycan-associated lipoprotein
MKRMLLLVLFGSLLTVALMNCGGEGPPPPPPEAPDTQVTVKPPTEPVDTTPPPPPPVLKESQLYTVHFEFDKYNLTTEAREKLDHNYDLLTQFPDAMIKLEGHCDERGTVEYNIALGEKRANAVKDYLVGRGINPSRLTTVSYGKERPVDPRHNEEAWAKNRRVEFVIMSQ